MLSDLVTGDNSLARKLQTSAKYSQIFQRLQRSPKSQVPDLAEVLPDLVPPRLRPGFSKVVKNLSFADQRFDSRSRPLFRLFELLPAAIETLAALTGVEGDVADRAWAQAGGCRTLGLGPLWELRLPQVEPSP